MNKTKMKYRLLSALLAVLLCFSSMGSVSFAAESEPPTEPSEPPATAGTMTAESTPEPTAAPLDGDGPDETAGGEPGAESTPEPAVSKAAQAFIDAVAAIDREAVLSAANTWGLAHRAWLEDQDNLDLQTALDEATAASDAAAVQLYAAEDLFYEIPEGEQEGDAVQAAYLSLMSIVVAMHEKMDDPIAPAEPAKPDEPTDLGTEGGDEPPTEPSGDEIASILYGDLPDAPTGSYMGRYGLPVAVGETKISIGEWAGEMQADGAGRMDADALNSNDLHITVPLQAGEDFAIVPVMVQVEYPANGSSSHIVLPGGVTVLRPDGSGEEASANETAAILTASYNESSASVSGILVKASEDFTARFVYEAPDGTVLEKSMAVHVDGTATTVPALYGVGSTTYAGRPSPAVTSGKITRAEKVNGTWLIWFNGEEAYCCDHGLTGKPAGCPTYTYSHTSIVEASQYTPGDHYRNQVEIWGGLGQLSLVLSGADASTFAAQSEDETAAACYDETQRWIMEHYPDSVAGQAYHTALDRLMSGTATFATDTDYYTYIYQPPIGGWQTVALMGGATDGSEEPDVQPKFYAGWDAPAQTMSGSLDLSYTINADKQQLATKEKVDGATIEIEPLTKSGSIEGGSWAISPAGKQTVTTSGHTMDDAYHTNGGDAAAVWSLHYSVSKTSGTRSGSVGPYSSQAEADSAADSARENAIRELRGEAQRMVDAAIASARQQLSSLQFRYEEICVPYGFEAYTGPLGSSQVIAVPSNTNRDYIMRNDEWSLQVKIDKRDSETGERIRDEAAFAVFEWDTVLQRYIPFGGYNQYAVERQSDGTYAVINHSSYADADPTNTTMYYTQRNEGKFIIVEVQAPAGYYGDWNDVSHPGAAGTPKGKRAYFIEITKTNDGSVIWLDNADYNAQIGMTDNGGIQLDTGDSIVSVEISDGPLNAPKTYITDKSGIAANEDGRTVQPVDNRFLNDRVLGEIILSKVDLDAMRYLAAGSNGNSTLEGAVYDLYAAEDIRHPDGVTGIVDYSKITDANGEPLWHTTVFTNGGWESSYLPVLKKDHLVASAAITNGKLAFANLYLGKYYLVERATGLTMPLDTNGQVILNPTYPMLDRKLQPNGSARPLARNGAGEYTDYVYRNRYSAVAEGRALNGIRTFDGHYLSFATGYLCDEVNHYVTLAYGDESGLVIRQTVQSEDEVLKSGFSINKVVSTTGQPGPAIKLDGAGFTVFRISDLSRAEQFVQNPDGSYQVQSILDAYRAESYDQDTPKYDFSGEAQAIATMYEGTQSAVDGYNRSLTSGTDNANGSGTGWQPTDKPGEYRLGEVFTNAEGILRVDGLAYGQYLIVETTVPKDVFQAAPFIVTVDSNAPQSVFCTPQGSVTTPSGSYMTYNILDEEIEGYLQLVKIDAETGKAVKLAKIAFSIFYLRDDGTQELVEMNDPASGNATAKTSVFFTDENGMMKTPEKLPLGRYRVIEVQGPEGFYNDEAYHVDFEITSERVYQVIGSSADSMDDYIATERYVNRETLGQLTIRKLGEVLTGWNNGQFEYTTDGLAGAVYEIRAHGDVYTADRQTDAEGSRTLWYADGDLVATVTTGADGQIDKTEFAPMRTPATYDFLSVSHTGAKGEVTVTLPLGSYDIREVQPPYGYLPTDAAYSVTLGWDNQSNDLVLAKTIVSHADGKRVETAYKIVNVKDAHNEQLEQQALIYTNEREKAKVGVYKIDAETGKYLAGAVFALYTSDNIYSADGELLFEAGDLIATSPESSEDGYTYFDADIPIRGELYGINTDKNSSTNSGSYYVQEVSTPDGYYLSNDKLPVTFTCNGQALMVLDNTCANIPTEMWVSKRKLIGSEELPGAALRIVDERGQTVREWVSGTEPQRITGLGMDDVYTLIEQTAPNGYAVAESIRFKLVQRLDEGGKSVNDVDVYICTGKDWLVFDHWELAADGIVVMRDAPAPEQPHEPGKPEQPKPTPTPAPASQPVPQTGDYPWLLAILAVTGTLCASAYAIWSMLFDRKEGQCGNDADNEDSADSEDA